PRALWRFLYQIYGNRSRLAPPRRKQPGDAWKAVVSINFPIILEPVLSEVSPYAPRHLRPLMLKALQAKRKRKSPPRRGPRPVTAGWLCAGMAMGRESGLV